MNWLQKLDQVECKRWFRWTVAIVFGVVIGQFSWTYVEEILKDRTPPITVIDTDIVEEVARPGDWVTLKVERVKHRDCALTVLQHWVNDKGEQVKGDTQPGGVVGVGKATIEVRIRIPEHTPPGEWSYSPVLVYQCGEDQMIVRQKPAWVRVE